MSQKVKFLNESKAGAKHCSSTIKYSIWEIQQCAGTHSFQVLFSRFALDLTFGDMHTTTSASKTITIMYDGPLSDTIEQLLHL